MKAQNERTWKVAYIFGRDEIKKVEKIFASLGQTPRINVKCFGGLALSPTSYDELLEISNSGNTTIKSMHFSSRYGSEVDLDLRFTDRAHSPIELNIGGEQTDVLRVSGEVAEIVEHCKTWYSPTAKLDTPAIWALGLLLVSACFGISVPLARKHPVFAAIGVILGLVILNGYSIIRFFFPLYIFRIGKGADAPGVYQGRRSYAFGGVILAVLTGLIVEYLSRSLGR